MVEKLPTDNFSWIRWRKGVLIWEKLAIHPRYNLILEKRESLRKYAVGYIESEKVLCRPKDNEIAVMFLVNGEFCWIHLRRREFDEVFI